MGFGARLVAYGTPQVPSPAPFTIELTTATAFDRLRKAGWVDRVWPIASGQDEDYIPLALASQLSFPDAQNQDTMWTDGGSNTYRAEIPAGFGGTINSIRHERAQSGTTGQYTSTFSVEDNQPFAFRLFLHKAPKEIKVPIFSLMFGTASRRWLFRIVDGTPEIALLKSTWTQTDQTALDALLELDGYDEDIDAERLNLYHQYQRLSGGISLKGGDFYQVVFIPEPRGMLNVEIDGSPKRIPYERMIEGVDSGNVYDAGPLIVRGNGMMFAWQYGYPLFASEGTLVYEWKYWGDHVELLASATIQTSEDQTPPGTSIVGVIEEIDSVWVRMKLTLETSNTRYTPYLYSAQGLLAGGERPNAGSEWWDSDDFPSVIEDASVSWDGDLLRKEWNIELKDTNGRGISTDPQVLLTSAVRYQALEHRWASFWVDGAQNVTLGLIRESGRKNMRAATEGQPLMDVTRSDTRVSLRLVDRWELLDEDLMAESPILDGYTLGAALRLLFLNGGESEAAIAGISVNTGRVLPSARLGEKPFLRPRLGQSRGDYIRELMERWGWNLLLYQGFDGIWYLTPRPTALCTVGGVPAAFERNSTNPNSKSTYPGRLKIGAEFDMTREAGQFYNSFKVVGGTLSTGQTLSAEWTIWESITDNNISTQSRYYIGRKKAYPTVYDESLLTESDVQYVLRSLVDRYGRPPRFYAFKTYFHRELYPGALVSLDGVICTIVRLSGSIKADEMFLVLQEVP